MPDKDTKVVYGAIASNVIVMVAKFVVAAISGSSSMLAESLHSVADTADGFMLLFGERRSKRPPDDLHPFGHGKELYFWTMVVALSIFGVGGCLSIAEGINRIAHPEPVEHVMLSVCTLAFAGLVEGAAATYAWIQFFKQKRKQDGVVEEVKKGKDPTTFTVVFEDTAAVVGVLIAIAATLLAHKLDKPWIDGLGAILIGLLVATVGVFLAIEVRKLLIGERVVLEDMASMTKILNNEPSIQSVGRLRTMHFGPETVVLAANVHFDAKLLAEEVAAASHRVVRAMQAEHPEVKYVFLHPIAANGHAK